MHHLATFTWLPTLFCRLVRPTEKSISVKRDSSPALFSAAILNRFTWSKCSNIANFSICIWFFCKFNNFEPFKSFRVQTWSHSNCLSACRRRSHPQCGFHTFSGPHSEFAFGILGAPLRPGETNSNVATFENFTKSAPSLYKIDRPADRLLPLCASYPLAYLGIGFRKFKWSSNCKKTNRDNMPLRVVVFVPRVLSSLWFRMMKLVSIRHQVDSIQLISTPFKNDQNLWIAFNEFFEYYR